MASPVTIQVEQLSAQQCILIMAWLNRLFSPSDNVDACVNLATTFYEGAWPLIELPE